jgi:hypothetical protein
MRNALYRMQGSVCRLLGDMFSSNVFSLRTGTADFDRFPSIQDSTSILWSPRKLGDYTGFEAGS